MSRCKITIMLPFALALFACSDDPAGPAPEVIPEDVVPQLQLAGTGLELGSVTGLAAPLFGQLGEIVVDQAIITNFALLENTVGQIIGLEAEGLLHLTGWVFGSNVVTQDFVTTVDVTSSGPGRCGIVALDLGLIGVNALEGVAFVELPIGAVSGRGSGPVGSLLCSLGSLLPLLQPGVSPGSPAGLAADGLVDAINQQQQQQGSGLQLQSVTGVQLPVLGPLGDIVIDQAVLTNFALLENTLGQVVGLRAEGMVALTGGVLESDVVTEDFLTTVSVTSSGPGQCRLIEINLAPIAVNVLERVVFVDVPAVTLSGRGSGALGSLLCNLGLTGGLGNGSAGLLNAINNRI